MLPSCTHWLADCSLTSGTIQSLDNRGLLAPRSDLRRASRSHAAVSLHHNKYPEQQLINYLQPDAPFFLRWPQQLASLRFMQLSGPGQSMCVSMCVRWISYIFIHITVIRQRFQEQQTSLEMISVTGYKTSQGVTWPQPRDTVRSSGAAN